MNFWLMKSEPDAFSIDDLKACKNGIEPWDGTRNYQVRNMLRDQMKPGDLAFFYHSNCKPPAIVGIMEIVSEGYPDHTAWDPSSNYYDPKSDPDNPRWFMVDVKYQRHLKRAIPLAELKADSVLIEQDFPLIRKGSRLSIMPVTEQQWQRILILETL
ncbi:MAG: EVE domain-containing protein [Kangiellaceae bacterium]|jgi:predicted RNA-binding protein with PUA-like domain|nr:EVE domain-containing protein [Kangiellaceae bacterium]